MGIAGLVRAAAVWLSFVTFTLAAPGRSSAFDLADLSLEQLGDIVVSSVSGREEPLAGALGSIYVISGDDIRRAGATSIPEALRLAPNLQVARAGSNGWAITARGFNAILASRLLVLIDGRVIYTPTFSGVFWDAQDVMLEDVDRIEVISGPGGVLWGANAFNGVINILTRSAKSTQGGLVSGAVGDSELRVSARHGGSDRYRLYVQGTRREDSERPDGTDMEDGIDRLQAGFRSDWQGERDAWTLQGDGYLSERRDQRPRSDELRGGNLLARWHRDFASGDRLQLQGYYDFASREQQDMHTADFEFGHTLQARGRHALIWGGGFRSVRDLIENTPSLAIIPAHKTLNSWNLYLQDEIVLNEHLQTAVGLKLDRNTYTGVEYLPSARVGWWPKSTSLLWAAVSRAVRTPSRFDRDLFLPGMPPFALVGGDFESEIAYVYELGFRGQPLSRFSWSAATFYHQLEKQRSIIPGLDGAMVANDREGHTSGVETWGDIRVVDDWRLYAGYTYLDTDLHVRAGAVDLQPESNLGGDPNHWWKVRSAMEFGDAWELDLFLRSYGALEIDVPSYTALDLRAGWRPVRAAELSVLVRNVTDSDHIEWTPGAELERSWLFRARLDL